ncbi:MAG: lysylphosphatidylglycerol synthase transmembrane domain-containing protein [Chloroflexota bacterium]
MTETTQTSSNNNSRRFAAVIGVVISIVFLVIAFRGLQPQDFMSSLSDVNVGLLLVGALTYFIAVVVIAWRWQFLLQSVQSVPLTDLTKIVAIGYMGNNVYPLRAGEALRLFLLKRNHDMPITSSATTVVVERVFDGIVMLSFILIGLFLLDVTSQQIQQILQFAVPIFAIAVIVFFVLASFPKALRGLIVRLASILPERLETVALDLSESILIGFGSLRSPLHLIGAVVTSYSTWAIEAGVYWIVMQAFDLQLSYPVALLVVGTVNLAGLIPASPGQVGIYEFFVSSVLIAVGIGETMALAYAVVVHIVIWLPITLVGFFFLIQYGLGWSAISNANALNKDDNPSDGGD